MELRDKNQYVINCHSRNELLTLEAKINMEYKRMNIYGALILIDIIACQKQLYKRQHV